MTVIAQDVFITAMNLMDEESEDGTYEGYPDEYKNKAWSFLTLLQSELLGPDIPPLAITNNLNVLQVDDRTGMTVLSYGLAAHLLINEDQNKAAFFNARYDELKRNIYYPVMTIQNDYDVFGCGELEQAQTATTKPDIDGGSFLDPKSGEYDGGEF